MAKKNIGYLLPDGDAYTDEIVCMLLFYPDKKEYRQALFGSLDYLGTWLAWERDEDKRGVDAGRAWAEAVALTRGCIDMNTCELILSLLQEIRDNTGVYCCDVVDITDGDQYTDPVEDGEGDVPQAIIDAGYAEDAADWEGFDDYKCIISHVMVTNMEWQTRKLLEYTDATGAVLGGVAAVAAIAAVILATGGTALVLGIILAIAVSSALYAAIAELGEAGLSDLADDVETNHDELVCAIYQADGSAGAVVALKDKIDELFTVAEAVFLKNLNLPAQLKALYAGRYEQQDIAEKLAEEGYVPGDFECCVPEAPAGAFAWPIEIIDVSFPADDSTFTTHSSSWDADGFTCDVTHHPDPGHYYYVTLTLAASPYWGTGAHKGIVYRGLRYTYADSLNILPDGGIQDTLQPAGYDNQDGWRMIYSSPYPDFDDDIEAYLGISFNFVFGTHGLQQNPDQSRTLTIRFWCKDINDPEHRFDCYLTQLYWAIDNT